jgi:hypothetical protein
MRLRFVVQGSCLRIVLRDHAHMQYASSYKAGSIYLNICLLITTFNRILFTVRRHWNHISPSLLRASSDLVPK